MATATAKKKTAPPPPDIEVVDAPVSEDQSLVSEEAGKLRSFMGGMVAFFSKASELEKAAKGELDVARQLQRKYATSLPATQDEDADIQTKLLARKRERKASDEFWGITSVLSKLHKATVAGRERTGLMLDEAAGIYQDIHNRFDREQRRLAEEENARRRREAEEADRQRREREQLELEAAAIKAEEASPELSEREKLFVLSFVMHGDGARAAQSAGFKEGAKAALRLLNMPKVNAAIEAQREAKRIREQAAAKQAEPVNVDVQTVKPAVSKVAGSRSVTTKSAEVYDVDAFMAAMLDPRQRTSLGIPTECVTIDQAKLNDQARQLGDLINKWPGVRLKTNTSLS